MFDIVKKVIVFSFLFFSLSLFFPFTICAQQSDNTPATQESTQSGTQEGENIATTTALIKFTNPLGTTNTANKVIANVIDKVLGVVGALALFMFIFGSITWMVSAGNDQQITKGKNILMWATLGMIVVFMSYALVKFIFQAIGV